MEFNMTDNEEGNIIQNQSNSRDNYFDLSSDTDSVDNDMRNLNLAENSINRQGEVKKLQSDSTTVVSFESSDQTLSENLTDSESREHTSSHARKKNLMSVLNMDEYPTIKTNKRSKSQMFKKRKYIENVVNEEMVEDDYERDNEIVSKRSPFKFSNINFNDDLPSNFSKNTFTLQCLKSVAISPSSRAFKGRSHTVTILPVTMDPVVEDKEEEARNEVKENLLSLNSPRVKFMTDNKEDVTLSTSSFHYFPKDYSIETNEVIAEDNNENLQENDCQVKKKESKHKILENMIDKEENYNIQELNVNINGSANFEIIDEEKEENGEEVEFIQHKLSNAIPVSDEFERDSIKFTSGFRLPVINTHNEDLINEEFEENKFDEDL